jgi:hypothetical protein
VIKRVKKVTVSIQTEKIVGRVREDGVVWRGEGWGRRER